MRVDRFITLNMACPLRRSGIAASGSQLPILMYHSISEDPKPSLSGYYGVVTNPSRFAEQMQWLSGLGYKGLSLEEALSLPTPTQPGAPRPVVLTFDDGFRNFYTTAWPILQRYAFTATVYLPTGFIGPRRQSFHGKECLTWNEVRELRAQGIRFGSHTVNHPKLYELGWREIELEASLSKARLDAELGEEITGFAYPYAFPQEDQQFTQALALLLRKNGYHNCVTTVVGRVQPTDDPFRLRRLPANSEDDRALLAAKLEGSYDWVSDLQKAFRSARMWRKRAARLAD